MNLNTYIIRQQDVDITEYLAPSCESIIITDRMGLTSDLLEINLNNDGLLFIDYFKQGDKISVSVQNETMGWFNTGSFYIDTLEGKIGDYTSLRIGAVSMPTNKGGLQKFVKYNRKRVRLKTLLSDICRQAGLTLLYRFSRPNGDEWNFELKNVTHMNERAGAIIGEYVRMYGLFLKVHDDTLIVSDKKSFKKDDVLFTVDPASESVENFSYSMLYNQENIYKVQYYSPYSGKFITDEKDLDSIFSNLGRKMFSSETLRKETVEIGVVTENERIKSLMTSIANPEEAIALARAIDGQKVFDVEFTVMGNTDILAGGVIEVLEMGKFSGKFMVTEAEHEITEQWKTHVKATALF